MRRSLTLCISLFIFAVILATPAGSTDLPVRGFDSAMYEYTYAEAYRATDPELWLLEARSGVAFAVARWERDAAGLYADPSSLSAARLQLDAWTAEDIADRFAVWLRDRFFGREAADLRYAMAEATQAANERYLYELDPDGSVSYDEAGNPRYLSPDEGLPLEQSQSAWNSETASATGLALVSYKARLESLCPELLSFIPPADRERYEPLIVAAIAQAGTMVSSELDNLIAREERLFVARRTTDVWSLRNKSEREAASVIAAALASEATVACDEGLAVLNARIEAASVDGGELELAGSEWLAAFKLQFDRGLTAWKQAEERFMVRRLEWERDAVQAFDDGNETWAKAFETLTCERQAWEARAGLLFRSGEEAFSRASETLETNIRDARVEFEQTAFERMTASSDRANAWVDVYLESGAAAAGAREGAGYWLSLLGNGVPAFSDPALGPWLSAEAAKTDASQQRKDWLAQAGACLQMYAQYAAKACESRDRLVADFGLALGSGAGSLRDILDAGAVSEDFCLDEYQVELIRARALEGYWQRRVEVAQAVLQYAVDLSSGRATAGDNIRNLEATSIAWKEALRLYDVAQDQLREAGTAVAGARDTMSSAQQALEAAGSRLESVNAEYAILMGVLLAGDSGFIRDAIITRYRDLIELSGLSLAEGAPSEAELLATYLEKARSLGYALAVERSGEALREAVNGIEGEPSLALLKSSWAGILQLDDPSGAPLDAGAYGIPESAAEYATIQALLAGLQVRLQTAGTARERDEVLDSFRKLLAMTAGIAKAHAAAALESRLDGIALLGATSTGGWYADRTGGKILGGTLPEALAADQRAAARACLLARVKLELEATGILAGVVQPQWVSDDANSLVVWWPAGNVVADTARASLARLAEFLRDNINADEALFNAGIESLAKSDAATASFVRGKGYFIVHGIDIGALYVSPEIEALERARGRYAACIGYGSSAMAMDEERRMAAIGVLGKALEPLGLALGVQGTLPDSRAIVASLFRGSVDTGIAIACLLSAADEAASEAPLWMARELSGWKNALLEHAAARSLYMGLPLPGSSTEYRAELSGSHERINNFSLILAGLAGDETSALQALCLAASEPLWTVAELRALEDEAARRIGLMLQPVAVAAGFQNPGAEPDWVMVEATLTAEAENRFGFAASGIRSLAVGVAMDSLRCRDAIASSRDPSLLTGAALEARLTDLWSALDIEGSRTIAASAGNTVARIAYSMQTLVFDVLAAIPEGAARADLLALSLRGPEGEPSWLDDFYASEGQDSGSAMQSLLESAAGSELEPWSLGLARDRVEAVALESLSELLEYRDGLRRTMGQASGVAERLLAEFLAISAVDPGYFSWQSEALGLGFAEGLAGFIGSQAPDDLVVAEAFLGLGSDPYATAAASHYLASLALSGDGTAFTSHAERAGEEASARGRSILDVVSTASGYAGEYSGFVLAWAFRTSAGDPETALKLVRYLEYGLIDDPLNSLQGSIPSGEGTTNPVNRWITETVTTNAGRVLLAAGESAARLMWAEACEQASLRAAASAADGEKHWREYLDSSAITNSGSGLPEPLRAGDPEGGSSPVPRAAAGWAEGVLADACEESARRTAALTAAFASWCSCADGVVPTAPAAYLLAPELPFDAGDVVRAPALASYEYQSTTGAYGALAYRRADVRASLAGFAKAFIIAPDQGAITARLAMLQSEQTAAKAASDGAMLGYKEAGVTFDAAGEVYEVAYTRANALYAAQETARAAYELEDAIRRWAGTAYLSAADDVTDAASIEYRSPGSELEYSRTSHQQASALVAALLGLHADADELRSYADPEYRAASAAYETNYQSLMLLAKAREALGGTLAKAYAENDNVYEAYQDTMFGSQKSGCPPIASVPVDYVNYTFPSDASDADWTDFLRLRTDGSVGLGYGSDYRLLPVDAITATQLANYFTASSQAGVDLQPASAYELDVRSWSSRVSGYMASTALFSVWASARDHLVSSLAAANPEYRNLASSVLHADNLYGTIGQKHLEGSSLSGLLASYASGSLATEQRTAWDSLDEQQRADLEFYLVMALSGGVELSSGPLESATRLREYEYASQIITSRIDASRRLARTLKISSAASWTLGILLSWTPAGPGLLGAAAVQLGLSLAATADADDWQSARRSVVDPGLEVQRQTMLSGLPSLSGEVSGIQSSYAAYHESCQRISVIQGTSQTGTAAVADFTAALEAVVGMEASDIASIVQLYGMYVADSATAYTGASDALASVYRWTLSKRDSARSTMENRYFNDQHARQLAEVTYREASTAYLAGRLTGAELESAIQAAYGAVTASGKTHLSRLAGIEQAAILDAGGDQSSREYIEAAAALADLTARATELRYSAELASREALWDLQRRDLSDKRLSWREAAGLILERGRADFDDGADLLRGQAAAWTRHFADGYASLKPAWDLAFAGMQVEKLSWVTQATLTAGNASAEAMLALVGPDAEAAARRLDTFSVSSLDFGIDARSCCADILDKAGIAGMDAAFDLHSGSATTLSLAVRKGASSAGSLDSGRIQAAAADFAESARERISGVQARLIAARARSAAAASVDGLVVSVRQANEGFSQRMTQVFLGGGMWKRRGGRYVKDIVVHSTVGTPYITEQADVEAFRQYALGDFSLKTDLSDGTLAQLGAASVQDLIGRAQQEVQARCDEVFGTAEELGADAVASRTRQVNLYRAERGVVDTRTLTWTDDDGNSHTRDVEVYGMVDVLDHTEEQTDGAGEFGRHLGYAPVVRLGANPDSGESGVFQAAGSGELGRLMASYIYWSLKEGKGWSEASKPLYEKDIWDDRGQWLQAPTIRGVVDIGVTVAAGILTGGVGSLAMNLVDDAVFGLLDISGGYQSWEQAGLDFGKKATLSAVNYSGGKLFGGALSSLASTGGLDKVVGTTLLTGMRTATTGLASSAIGAVGLTFDGNGGVTGLGFDVEGFKARAFGEASVASFAGSMAGAAFSTSMDSGSAYTRKLWSGLTDAGSMAATEGAKFVTHLGYSASRGTPGSEVLNDAWNNYGGLTLDVANLGSIMSAAGFIGGVTSDGYNASGRAGYNKFAGAIAGVGLSLTLGSDGVSGTLGGGGYNLVRMGVQTGKGMLLDAKLQKYAIAQGTTVESVMKTAYGYGDAAAEETVWRIVSGRDTLSFDNTGGRAETVADSSGGRAISLMASGGGTGAMLDMAVALQHESWRDGLPGDAAGQGTETLRAAGAHTEMTLSLARGNEYGDAMAARIRTDHTYQDDLNHYLYGDFASYVGRAYDSSGDFWKLTKEGKLINDGKARLLAEIVNDDGTTGWHTVEDSLTETSTAAALVHYLGPARAMELFSGSLCDMTRYDDETLRDVLNLDDIDLKVIRNNPGEAERLIAAAGSEQRERLLGEALMKGSDITWSTEAGIWSGDGSGLTLSDRAIVGAAAIRSIGGGSYERYSISSEIERREGAYGVWMDGIKGDVGEGNTRISFTKWDIDSGEQLATILAGGAWNSVDNSYGQLDSSGRPIGEDQRYQIAFGPTLQGNTIAEGPLNLRLAQTPKVDWGDVFIISDTKTIAGDTIQGDGRRPGYPLDARWLGHATKYGSSDGCPVYKRGDDATDQFAALMQSLTTWGLYGGYSISGLLSDDNEFPYQAGYRKGAW